MVTRAKEQQKDKPSSTVAASLQAVESSPVIQEGVKPLQAFFTKFSNDWAMNLQAGALAYNLLLAIFPLAVALLALLGLLLGRLGPSVQQSLIQGIQQALPHQKSVSTGVIQQIFTNLSKDSGPLGLIAVVVAIFGGSRLFVQIEACFAIIYQQRPRPFVRQNVMAIGMLLLFVLLIPLMVLASSGPPLILSLLKNTSLSLVPGSSLLWSAGGTLSSLLVTWMLFEAIYLIVPNRPIRFNKSWPGAVVAAMALQIYLTLFPLYATRFLGGYIGQVGFAVILIVFFYYFAVILLLGAEINAFFAEGIPAPPENLAAMVHRRTSHQPPPKEEGQQQAASSPKGKEPAGGADTKPNAEPLRKKKLLPAQQQPVPPPVSGKQEKRKQPWATSWIGTLIEVTAGTILTVVIELRRLRQRE